MPDVTPPASIAEEVGPLLIEHILHRKGGEVVTIAPDATVADAVALLRRHNVGALVVAASGGGNPVAGILSERDIVRALGTQHVEVFAGAGFVSAAEAGQRWAEVASANWLATANLVARLLPGALVIDAGSTTTDIVVVAGDDVSVRDVQRRHGGQWFKGKNFDTHLPLGPWIVTADELDPSALRIQTRVNGVTKQDSNTRFMVFKIPRLVSEFSLGATLEPGDVMITGTPEGVGFARKPPEFLRIGDTVEVEIEGIGVLRNTVQGRS